MSQSPLRTARSGPSGSPPPGADNDLRASLPSERAAACPGAHRILVVDDNRDAADSLEMVLRAYGHEVLVAYDGLEAVEATHSFRPDIVLLDIGLPKLNGFDVARRIRASRGDQVLLIAVTGWGQEEDRRKSREAGFDHHLTKPVDFTVLLNLIAQNRQ